MKKTLLAIIILVCNTAIAQWNGNTSQNNSISNAAANQDAVQITNDYSGGSIMCWLDRRGAKPVTYVQRITADGIVKWIANGNIISSSFSAQSSPKIASDGVGGAYIVWLDFRNNTDNNIYAQHIDSTGAFLWTSAALLVCNAVDEQSDIAIKADSTYGLYITWTDNRTVATTSNDIYIQRITPAGTVVFAANGIPINNTATAQTQPNLILDGSGNAIVTYSNYINSIAKTDIWASKVTSTGTVAWSSAISASGGNEELPKLVTDQNGGAIICWQYGSLGASGYDIYAQRVNGSGVVQWVAGGKAICTANGTQANPEITSDSLSGAIVAWVDGRQGLYVYIYSQRINGSGTVLWTSNGILVGSTAVNTQQAVQLVANGSNGATYVWVDSRTNSLTGQDVYTQQVSSTGTLLWGAVGSDVSVAVSDQLAPMIIRSGTSDYIVAWNDYRNASTGSDIYASKLSALGRLAGVVPLNILAFYATQKGNDNVLNWHTANETNNLGFEIERSGNAVEFEKIGFVAANNIFKYAFNDIKPLPGKNYYRLKQLDVDGKYRYSNIVLVNRNQDKAIVSIFPNPATNQITIAANTNQQMFIVNAAGAILKTLPANASNTTVDISNLAAGAYYLKTENTSKLFIKK